MSFTLRVTRKNRSTVIIMGVAEIPAKGKLLDLFDGERQIRVKVTALPDWKGQPVEAAEV